MKKILDETVLFPSEERLSPKDLGALGIRVRRDDTAQQLYSLDDVERLLATKQMSIGPTSQTKGEKRSAPPVDKCSICSLRDFKMVPMSGPSTAKVLFVGEAPGASEDSQGLPFVGQSGELLRRIIKEAGIDEAECAFTNVVKCRPPINRMPSQTEIECCRPKLEADISEFKGLIVTLGATSLKALLKKDGLAGCRSFGFIEKGKQYFVTYHPAYILRNRNLEDVFLADLKKVAAFVTKRQKLSYTILNSINEIEEFCAFLKTTNTGVLSCDIETTSLDPHKGEILSVGFSDGVRTWVIPVKCVGSKLADVDQQVFSILESGVFSNPEIKIVMHNALFDLRFMKTVYGIEIYNLYMDTQFAHFILEGKHTTHALKSLAWKYTDFGGYDVDRTNMQALSFEQLLEYNGWDALVTALLTPLFFNLLTATQRQLVTDVIPRAMLAISEIETQGIGVDGERIGGFIEQFSSGVASLEERMHAVKEVQELEGEAGRIINVNSPQQILQILVKMGMTLTKKTRGGAFSADNEVLESFKSKNPFIDLLLEYREKEKVLNTYLTPYKSVVESGINTIYGDYSFIRTDTGRLSCREPNMQNIPENVRSIFVPKFDWFLSVDYSQIELRVLACFCHDEKMVKAFKDGVDIHARVGKEIFGKDKLTKEERTRVKGVNFGTVYGITEFGLSRDLGCSEDEATSILERFYSAFPAVKDFQSDVKSFVLKHKYYETVLGRRRWFSINSSTSKEELRGQLRQAINFPIQGTASDLVQDATGRMWRRMREGGVESRMVAHVHDEVVFDVKENELEDLIVLVKDEMETFSFPWVIVPLKVGIKIGKNWKDMKEIEL